MIRVVDALRWEAVQAARAVGTYAGVLVGALIAFALVTGGIELAAHWVPWAPRGTQAFPSFGGSGFGLSTRINERAAPIDFQTLVSGNRGPLAFYVAMLLLMGLTFFLGPAFAASSIIRDRRNRRLDRMLLDAASASTIVLAKLWSGLVPLLFVLLSVVPMISFAWFFGGVPWIVVAISFVELVSTVLLVDALSVFCSSVARSEAAAIVASYVVLFAILAVPIIAYVGLSLAASLPTAAAVLTFHPFAALLDAQPGFATRLAQVLPTGWPPPFSSITGRAGSTSFDVPVWLIEILAELVVSFLLIWGATVAIEPYHRLKTWRLRRAARQLT